MAVNPDNLLIFKARQQDTGETQKDKKKAAKSAPAQQQTVQVERPAPVAQPQPSQSAQPQPRPRPIPQKPAQQPTKKPPAAQPEEVPPPSSQEPIVKGDESYYIAPANETANTIDYVSEATDFSGAEELEAQQGRRKPILKKRNHMDSRKIAQHMSCELHPWRRAYAICDICKRAFCYEDILETGGKYYCLDDVDKIPESVRRSQVVKYNNLSMISSIMYMVAFAVFFYYSYSSVLLLLTGAQKIGLALFMTQLTLSRELLLGQAFLALLSLVTALSILVSSGNSFKLSAIVSMVSVAVFGYQYSLVSAVGPSEYYLLVIGVLTFVAFVLLSYSRVSTSTMPEGEDLLEESLARPSAY